MRLLLKCFQGLLVVLLLVNSCFGTARPFVTRWQGEAGKALKIPIVGKNFHILIKRASDSCVLKTEPSLSIEKPEDAYTYMPEENGLLLIEVGAEGVEYFRMGDLWNTYGSTEQLLSVEQFGDVVWITMEYAFYGCTFLQFGKKIDVPNLRCVRSLESMFGDCEMFNQPIENWDVSTIESMERMFVRAYAFNQPLNGWNVSNVTTMETMFWGARSFNQPLDRWDVRKVRSMKYMFSYATSFDQELGMWKLKRCETLSLRYCGMSVENYSKSLATWAAQTGNSKALLLQADGLKYDERGETARTELVQKRKWIIEGDSAL